MATPTQLPAPNKTSRNRGAGLWFAALWFGFPWLLMEGGFGDYAPVVTWVALLIAFLMGAAWGGGQPLEPEATPVPAVKPAAPLSPWFYVVSVAFPIAIIAALWAWGGAPN